MHYQLALVVLGATASLGAVVQRNQMPSAELIAGQSYALTAADLECINRGGVNPDMDSSGINECTGKQSSIIQRRATAEFYIEQLAKRQVLPSPELVAGQTYKLTSADMKCINRPGMGADMDSSGINECKGAQSSIVQKREYAEIYHALQVKNLLAEKARKEGQA